MTAAPFYLSHWMKKKRKTYGKLFKRFRQMLEVNEQKKSSPSISGAHNSSSEEESSSLPERQRTS